MIAKQTLLYFRSCWNNFRCFIINQLFDYLHRSSKAVHCLQDVFLLTFKKYADCAVVTGSKDGIGILYARELTRRKMNIVLVSRNLEKITKHNS